MERFTKHLRWLLASLMLVVGVSAWAQDPYYTLDTTTDAAKTTSNSYAGTGTATIGGIEWAVNGNGQMYPWRLGGKSISNTDRTVKTNTAMGSAINKVVLTVGTASSITVNSLKLTVASDASFSNVLDEVTATFAASSDITFEPSTGTEWATGAYYKFTFNVTVSQSSNKFVQFSGVKFYKAEDTGDTRTETTVEFPASAYSFNLGETFTSPVATLTPAAAGSVTYASSKESVATVDASTGALTLVAAGTTTITATFAETTQYKGSHAQYTLTVVDPNANDGSEEHPYTVAEARAAIDAGTGITGVYVKGIVSEIVTAYNSQYGNITYNITEDGTTDGDFLQAYRGKSYNGDNFTSADDIQVGDEVVIYGNLKKYNTTYEFDSNNQLVSNSRTAPDTRTPTTMYFAQDRTTIVDPGTEFTITVGETVPAIEGYVKIGDYDAYLPFTTALTYSGNNDALGNVDATTGAVTLVDGATGTLKVTATFDGDTERKGCEGYYTLKVKAATPTTGDLFNETFADFDSTGGRDDSYSGTVGNGSTTKTDEEGWTFEKCGGASSSLKFGTGSANGVFTTRSIALTGDGTLTFSAAGWSSGTNTLAVTATDGTLSGDTDVTLTNGEWTDYTVNITGATGDLVLTFTGKRGFIDDIKVVSATPDERTATTTSFNAPTESYEVTLGEAFTAPTATLDPAAAGSLIYESSDPAVATVNANTGAVEILAAGTTTITAKFEGNNNYKPSQASYTITVTVPNAKGTETNPYTVTEAIAYIETLGTSISPSDVYVSGIISQVDSYNSTYKSITYWISDDGETTTQMEVYSGKGLEGADFSAAEDLQKGDIVTIFGFVKKYSGTPEFDKNNKLVSFERPAVAVEAPVFSVDGGTYTEDQTVTITCATTGASIYYTLDGTEPTTASTPYTAALTISETTTLKAIASDGTNVSTVTTATYTINKVEKPYALNYGTEYYTKVTDLSQLENGDAVIIVNDSYNFALSTNQQTNNRKEVEFEWMPWIGGSFVQLADNSTVEKFILVKEEGETDASYYFYASRGTADGYIYAASSSGNQLKTSDTKSDNAKATIAIENGDVTIKFQGSNTRNQLMYNSQSGLFSCYTSNSNQQSVQLYVERPAYVSEADQQVTVADAQDCYKTFITPYDAHFDGVNDHAYIVTLSADQKQAILKEVSVVPAGTPIIYKYETAGTHPITRAISGSDVLEDVSDNVLKVSRGEVTGDGTIFVLNNVSGIGFYRLNEGKTLGMGKCYIKVEQSAGVKFIGINFDGDATGIATVDSEGNVLDGPVFNLAGQRVAVPAHGLYIVNGKKVFIK